MWEKWLSFQMCYFSTLIVWFLNNNLSCYGSTLKNCLLFLCMCLCLLECLALCAYRNLQRSKDIAGSPMAVVGCSRVSPCGSGNKPRSSTKAVSSLNRWVISPASITLLNPKDLPVLCTYLIHFWFTRFKYKKFYFSHCHSPWSPGSSNLSEKVNHFSK